MSCQCGIPRTRRGHDGCIADLPGVHFACCGHNDVAIPYVVVDRQSLYGQVALERMRELGGNPPEWLTPDQLLYMIKWKGDRSHVVDPPGLIDSSGRGPVPLSGGGVTV